MATGDPISADLAALYGLRSVTDGGMVFCGVSEEAFAINGVTYQWPRGSKLTWGIAFSRLGDLSDMDCKDAIALALREISECCDVTHEYVKNANAANLKIISQRLDGPSGVLADCQIPVGNVHSDSTQLLMRFDDSERYGLFSNPPSHGIDFYRVFLHEAEHFHGLGHKPASVMEPALIAPTYNTRIRNLQQADIAELVRRYGPQKSKPAPQPQPPSGKAVTVTVEQNGLRWKGDIGRA